MSVLSLKVSPSSLEGGGPEGGNEGGGCANPTEQRSNEYQVDRRMALRSCYMSVIFLSDTWYASHFYGGHETAIPLVEHYSMFHLNIQSVEHPPVWIIALALASPLPYLCMMLFHSKKRLWKASAEIIA